eukprot:gnl/TRDRNA2_/TRDRNA2_136583_c0_seq1.p2 gnl/TRDRNA2_/TRDRNA2_136583_c0~~gnl/TRDRNA2_/TRDRNA2_136583_c0_seq1.p2  ORF type:complete len:103 (+),score=15.69 gnl/TRDRNA2_/TRDRNA2_136583_c0_seq1:353-661(+)
MDREHQVAKQDKTSRSPSKSTHCSRSSGARAGILVWSQDTQEYFQVMSASVTKANHKHLDAFYCCWHVKSRRPPSNSGPPALRSVRKSSLGGAVHAAPPQAG